IADQARMRRDLQSIRPDDDTTIELRLYTSHRIDLVADRTRTINRLRGTLLSMFPALERALELTNAGPLVLLAGYQTPAALRRIGVSRLTTWLRNRKVRGADSLAKAAVEAAERQHTAVAGEKAIAQMVLTLAKEVMALNEKIAEIDKLLPLPGRPPTTMPGTSAMCSLAGIAYSSRPRFHTVRSVGTEPSGTRVVFLASGSLRTARRSRRPGLSTATDTRVQPQDTAGKGAGTTPGACSEFPYWIYWIKGRAAALPPAAPVFAPLWRPLWRRKNESEGRHRAGRAPDEHRGVDRTGHGRWLIAVRPGSPLLDDPGRTEPVKPAPITTVTRCRPVRTALTEPARP
ncbi:transposase, partial [Streptomyces sp. NPDC087658]|uniref:IS110 family transposase n=1 Tax=Streptomyces sp. NPDC087658 TaxID=3365800 RepID=UPI003815F30E